MTLLRFSVVLISMLRFWSPHLYVYYILYCFVVTSLSLFNGISLFDQKNIPTALSGSFRTLGLITENRRNETAVNVADCSWQVAKERGQKKEKERERENYYTDRTACPDSRVRVWWCRHLAAAARSFVHSAVILLHSLRSLRTPRPRSSASSPAACCNVRQHQ